MKSETIAKRMMDAKEALAVFDGMKENLRNLVRPKEANGLDFSFVTPTLLGIFVCCCIAENQNVLIEQIDAFKYSSGKVPRTENRRICSSLAGKSCCYLEFKVLIENQCMSLKYECV